MFKIGDVVSLRSGGHWMTVAGVEEDEVTCQWHNDQGDLWEEKFDVEVLSAQEEEG